MDSKIVSLDFFLSINIIDYIVGQAASSYRRCVSDSLASLGAYQGILCYHRVSLNETVGQFSISICECNKHRVSVSFYFPEFKPLLNIIKILLSKIFVDTHI